MSNYKDPKDSNQPKNDETIHRSRTKNKKSKSGLSGKLSSKTRKKRSEKSAEAAAAVSGEVAVKKTDKKKVLKIILCVILALALIGIIYVAAVIITAPKIETDNIYSCLLYTSRCV